MQLKSVLVSLPLRLNNGVENSIVGRLGLFCNHEIVLYSSDLFTVFGAFQDEAIVINDDGDGDCCVKVINSSVLLSKSTTEREKSLLLGLPLRKFLCNCINFQQTMISFIDFETRDL